MPEVSWLLEHVRLRVDSLKDAAGSLGDASHFALSPHPPPPPPFLVNEVSFWQGIWFIQKLVNL